METNTLILILISIVVGNILLSLVLGISSLNRRREIEYQRKLYQAVGAVYSLTKEARQSDHEVQRDIGIVSQATTQMLQYDRDMHREIGVVSEATKHVLDIKDDISRLQELLRSSRKRGKLGEVLLNTLLEDALPNAHFQGQYQFQSGNRVDAIIRLDQGIVAIDSKFPLSNYERLIAASDDSEHEQIARQFGRDVRKHIDDIATKYISPGEGTLDFALMFVPSEAVYYEIVTSSATLSDGKNLIEYALERRVFPVSPCTFYPYLLTIARGLRQLYIAEHVRETIAEIAQLEQDLVKQSQKWETARKQIDDARRNLGDVQASLDMLRDKILTITTPSHDFLIMHNPDQGLPDE
jgi:DNA recombination protein RmuC